MLPNNLAQELTPGRSYRFGCNDLLWFLGKREIDRVENLVFLGESEAGTIVERVIPCAFTSLQGETIQDASGKYATVAVSGARQEATLRHLKAGTLYPSSPSRQIQSVSPVGSRARIYEEVMNPRTDKASGPTSRPSS